MSLSVHIPLETLAQFVAGMLDDQGQAEVQAHLSGCVDCCKQAANLPDDPLALELREAWVDYSTSHAAGPRRPVAPWPSPEPSRPINLGDFRLLREAGRGGMGIVYEAVQQSLGRHVALKVLPPSAVLDPRYLARFRREAMAVARLHHPNIAPVFGVGEEAGVHYFAMQFIRGRGLDDILKAARDAGGWEALGQQLVGQAGSSSPGAPASTKAVFRRIAEIGIEAASALEFAHGRGVLHRDVKPSNIMLDTDGHVWITDFGLAKTSDEQQDLTGVGDLIGTLRYMGPERIQGGGDGRSDVYSLGLVLYELATGRTAYAPSNRSDLIREILDGPPLRPGRLNPELPRDLETVILKATAMEPSLRYPTAAALAEDLHRFVDDRPVLASRTSLPRRLLKWARRKPVLAGLASMTSAAVIIALIGVTTALVQSERRLDTERRALKEQAAQRDQMERVLYASRIAQAAATWEQNDVGKVVRILDDCRPAPGREDLRGWEWHYLNRLCHADLFPNMVHSKWVQSVAVSPDGRWIATTAGIDEWYIVANNAREPGEVKLWDARTGRLVAELGQHANTVTDLMFSTDGTRLASLGYDGTIHVWDPSTTKELSVIRLPYALGGTNEYHSGEVGIAFLNASLDVLGLRYAKGPSLRIIDLASGKERVRTEPLEAVHWAFTPDGRFALGHTKTRISVRDVATGREVRSWEDPGEFLHVSPDGRYVACTGSFGSDSSVYEIASGKRVHSFANVGRTVVFSSDGRYLVNVGDTAQSLRLDLTNGATHRFTTAHDAIVSQAAMSPNGRSLALACSDNTVRIYDLASGEESRVLRGHTSGVRCLAFYPDGTRLVSGGQDGKVKVWDVRASAQGLVSSADVGGGEWVGTLTFRDAGRHISMVSHDAPPRVLCLDSESGRTIARRELTLNKNFVVPRGDSAFSLEGDQVAGIGQGLHDARVWDVATGRERMHTHEQSAPLRYLALSHDARYLATVSHLDNNTKASEVKVWDVSDGKELASLRFPAACLAFSPDGGQLALGPVEGPVSLWGWKEALAPRDLPGQTAGLTCLTYSRDGSRLAAAEKGTGLVRVWDLVRNAPLFHEGLLEGLQGPPSLTAVTFSPDGRRIAAIGYDGVALLWDASTGRELLTLRTLGPRRLGDFAYNARLFFSPDGKRLAANNWKGSVTIWTSE